MFPSLYPPVLDLLSRTTYHSRHKENYPCEPIPPGDQSLASLCITMIGPYPEQRSSSDVALDLVRAAADFVPTLPVILEMLILPPLRKRQLTWFNELASMLNDVQSEVQKLRGEQLKLDDEFLTLLIHASQAALRTHDADKRRLFLEGLRSAVLEPGDFDRRQFFFRLLDEYQLLHIKVLRLFDNPAPLLRQHYRDYHHVTDLGELAQLEYPPLRDFISLVLRDLESRSLIHPKKERFVESLRLQVKGTTTDLGCAFLRFIREPTEPQKAPPMEDDSK